MLMTCPQVSFIDLSPLISNITKVMSDCSAMVLQSRSKAERLRTPVRSSRKASLPELAVPGAEGNVSEEPCRDKGKQEEDERIEVVREESALQGCTRADGRGSIEPCKARSSIALSRDHERLARTAVGQRHPEDRRDRARLGCRIDGLTIDADLDRVARADEFSTDPFGRSSGSITVQRAPSDCQSPARFMMGPFASSISTSSSGCQATSSTDSTTTNLHNKPFQGICPGPFPFFLHFSSPIPDRMCKRVLL